MVHLKAIWGSMNGPSEVDLRVELETIRGMFWGTFLSIWGPSEYHWRSIQNPFRIPLNELKGFGSVVNALLAVHVDSTEGPLQP